MSAETRFPDRLRITDGRDFDLAQISPRDRVGRDKPTAAARIRACIDRMSVLQGRLAAQASTGILVILQGMDTSGKDGAIRHAFSGLNPQGVRVTSFKSPGPVEKRHDDLWRIHLAVPGRGEIGIFNRSHYEDVLIARIHPDMVRDRGLDPDAPDFWDKRLADLRHFETMLHHQNIRVIKIFLHISPEKQRSRLLRRLDKPEKRWKFDPADLAERERWPDYAKAYTAAIRATATPTAPWIIIPADRKWLARLLVAEALLDTLESLNLPEPKAARSPELEAARATLLKEQPKKNRRDFLSKHDVKP